ncbi:MAG: aminopeptidase P family protein [Gemmatimonadetes bacterium]|nr:aminopeptidase P family protein [Gemmatimonadota bacterium]
MVDPLGSEALLNGARAARAREALERAGWKGLVLVPGPNLRYLTGLAIEPSERLTAAILPARGPGRLLAPAFEADRLAGGLEETLEIVPWPEHADPFAVAAGLIAEQGWLLDATAPFWIAEAFHDRGVRLRSAGALCAALRRRKDEAELDRISAAQRLTRETLVDVPGWLSPGVRERDVAERILAAFRAAGAPGWAIVQFGDRSALPHGRPGERRLTPESAVLVDLGAVRDGYHADLTRSWWFGSRPEGRYGEVASAVEQAQSRAAALARPGARAGDVDAAARRFLEQHGLAAYFVHRLGHGIGLEIHEPPFLVHGSEVLLEAGDVFTIEPGVYLPGQFGIRHEDVWVIREDGSERL